MMLSRDQAVLANVAATLQAVMLCILFFSCAADAVDLRRAYIAPVAPQVTTIAGDGELGVVNGPALRSSFMEPSGLAVATDGTVYVADASAQVIRAIKHGVVTTLAGTANSSSSPQLRRGGYLDGAASTARFNHPMGLLATDDGTVYVADLLNHCIRVIKHGVVKTFAGSNVAGSSDGPAHNAGFSLPLALASDGDGNIYVADFGNGIRRITPGGMVSTLPFAGGERKVYGVAARGRGAALELAWTSGESVSLKMGTRQVSVNGVTAEREPVNEGLFVGRGDSIAIVGPDAVVVTDLITNSVRFIRMPSERFDRSVMTRSLAGGIHEGDPVMGGFQDGPSTLARVDDPLAVVTSTAGDLYVADAGNRRIRKISAFNTRGPVLDNLDNLVGPPKAYNVVVIGAEDAFTDVLWDESIEGQIEEGLSRDANHIALHRNVHVSALRMDASSVSTRLSFVRDNLGKTRPNLIVLLVSPPDLEREFATRPELSHNDRWKVVLPLELKQFAADLKRRKVSFVLAIIRDGHERLANGSAGVHLSASGQQTSADSQEAEQITMSSFEDTFASTTVATVRATSNIAEAEEPILSSPLFSATDSSLSPTGSTWTGEQILDKIEQLKPWVNDISADSRKFVLKQAR